MRLQPVNVDELVPAVQAAKHLPADVHLHVLPHVDGGGHPHPAVWALVRKLARVLAHVGAVAGGTAQRPTADLAVAPEARVARHDNLQWIRELALIDGSHREWMAGWLEMGFSHNCTRQGIG